MSDNTNKSSGRKDSFAKPGDENIVSGKSFFLPFGKPKKGPANPLLESEKHKNENAASSGNGGEKKNFKNAKHTKPEDTAKSHDTQKTGEGENKKPHFGKNRHEKKNRSFSEKGAGIAAEPAEDKSGDTKQGNLFSKPGRNDKGRSRNDAKSDAEKAERLERSEKNDKSAVKSAKHEPVRKNAVREEAEKNEVHAKNHDAAQHKNFPDGRRDRKNRREQNEESRHGSGRDRKNAKPVQSSAAEKPQNNYKNEKNERPERNDKVEKLDKSDRNQRQRQKPKKEKFVPSAPADAISDESLLQPIVNRAGLISGVKGGGLIGGKKSRFGIGALNGENDDTTVYIDRNRPLAEQIAEWEKPKVYSKAPADGSEAVEVIGVRFREAGKVYYFAPGENKVGRGEPVIVETARGVEYGICAIANRMVSADDIVAPLKPILRPATTEDTERYNSNKQLEEGAAKIFREKVAQLGLEMSLVYVEYTFDNGKLLFYFTADGRVDFRELIKELASAFRTRIELRQIGVRDEAKIVGGLGICGRPVCCKSFLGEFSLVSIKMAKDQNLFLNSSKISGTCGRFMCCIRYEDDVYQKEYEKTPKVDAIVETPEGKGVVVESNALKGVVKVLLDEKPDELAKPFKNTEVKLLGYVKRENENVVPEGVEIPEEGSAG